jgi:hypothetical protein
MADNEHFARFMSLLSVDPLTNEQRRRAALNVCSAMERRGHTPDQMREVLEALDLMVRSQTSRSR